MCCFLEAYEVFLPCSFFRITNCVWTSPLKSRKKNRDLKMGTNTGPFRAWNYRGQSYSPILFHTANCVNCCSRALSCTSFQAKARISPQPLIRSSSCPQAASSHNSGGRASRNVAVAAYLRTCGWQRKPLACVRRGLEEHFLTHLPWPHRRIGARGWAGGGLVTETLLFFKRKFCAW